MAQVDQQRATCELRTRREGLLAAVGHDLRLAVTRFSIEVSPAPIKLSAAFEVRSIEVVCALVGGRDAHGALSDDERREIQDHVRDLLGADTHSHVKFELTSVGGARPHHPWQAC